MFWICLLADTLFAAATITIEQPAANPLVIVGSDTSSQSVTASEVGDAEGRSVDIASPKVHSSRSGGRMAGPGRRWVGQTRLTSGFGARVHPIFGGVRFHEGIDLAAPIGVPIHSASDGVVSAAGWSRGYGLLVSMEHARGVQTRYGHLMRLNVTPGQRIRKGDVIGFVGSTGSSTGPHLHYELRLNGVAMDPVPRRRTM
jgi:murein DD-endopeptidase MepM/ murein hydrolase activator NlpD